MKEGCCWMEWCRVGLVTEQGCGGKRQRRLKEGDRGGHGPRTGRNTIGEEDEEDEDEKKKST
jgi:hypothetical protein